MMYMLYLPPIIIIGLLFVMAIVSIVRGSRSAWRWLFVLEALFLWLCIGNCFAPHSTKQFFQLELPLALIAVALALASSFFRIKAKRMPGSQDARRIGLTAPMYALYIVLFVVFLIVMMFLSTLP